MQRKKVSKQSPYSDVWRQLLNGAPVENDDEADKTEIPVLKSDPWRTLLQARGVEIIDLQRVHLHMSDQDVERLLQGIQESDVQSTGDDRPFVEH